MRLLALLLCVILLLGCAQKQEKIEAVELPPKVYYSEDFTSGVLDGWSIHSSGGGSIKILDRENIKVVKALEMRSQGLRSAYAITPEFDMDYTRQYAVSFDLLFLHRDNFGFTLYKDRNIELVLEQATGIACNSGGKKQFLGRFDTNNWHNIGVVVYPQYKEYAVYLDGENKGSCDFIGSDVVTFLLGDTDTSDVTYGDGLWDNIKLTDRL